MPFTPATIVALARAAAIAEAFFLLSLAPVAGSVGPDALCAAQFVATIVLALTCTLGWPAAREGLVQFAAASFVGVLSASYGAQGGYPVAIAAVCASCSALLLWTSIHRQTLRLARGTVPLM